MDDEISNTSIYVYITLCYIYIWRKTNTISPGFEKLTDDTPPPPNDDEVCLNYVPGRVAWRIQHHQSISIPPAASTVRSFAINGLEDVKKNRINLRKYPMILLRCYNFISARLSRPGGPFDGG